jgi:hypothetical protein
VNQEQGTGPRSNSALVDYYADLYLKEQAEKEKAEAQAAADAQAKAAKVAADTKAQAEYQLWLVGVTQMFDTLKATDAERARVLALPTVKVGDSPDKVGGILLTLRDATRGNKPTWASGLVKEEE